MKKVERKARFNAFYHATYDQAMAYCMAKTGDFINGEDLLEDAYYAVYKKILKDKKGQLHEPERYLYAALDARIEQYWKKHRKEQFLAPAEDEVSLDAMLELEFDLTEETAVKQMLVQDILEFVSAQPAPMRRAFAMYFYLEQAMEEIAAELGVSTVAAQNYLYHLLQAVRENCLEDYE